MNVIWIESVNGLSVVEFAAWRYADGSEAKAKAKAETETWSIGEMLCYTIVGKREVKVF